MKPVKANRLLSFENPLVEHEEFQVLVDDDGTTRWMLLIKDPDTGEVFHWEPVPPVHLNPYL